MVKKLRCSLLFVPANPDEQEGLNNALIGSQGGNKKGTSNHPSKTQMLWVAPGRESCILRRLPRYPSARGSLCIFLWVSILPDFTEVAIPVIENREILPVMVWVFVPSKTHVET